jgi:hypothetical protein
MGVVQLRGFFQICLKAHGELFYDINPLMLNGNYTFHLLYQSLALHFPHRLYYGVYAILRFNSDC